jgi:hypothetical protein
MYENRIMRPIKIVKKRKGDGEIRMSNTGGEFDQSTLYVCMETAQ